MRREIEAKRSAAGALSRLDVVEMMLALAVELLLMKPMRIATLARLDLERHVTRTRPAPEGIVHLTVPAEGTKNRVPMIAALPAATADLLELYRTQYRPLLLSEADAPSPWLFPGESGDRPKRPDALGAQIGRFIRRRTGLVVNVHLFRHLAAMIILNHRPGAYEEVRQVLGNKSIGIVTRYYCGAEHQAALRRYDEAILGLRLADETPELIRRAGLGRRARR